MTDDEIETGKSRTQVKREFQALHDLARELLLLPAAGLAKIPMSDPLSTAVSQAKTFKRNALARQLRYIANLLSREGENAEAIRVALEASRHSHREQTRQFHEIETWRDRLIGGDQSLLNELIARYENIDRQHLFQLVRNAQKEQAKNPEAPARKAARILFQYLMQLASDTSSGAGS